MIGIYMYTNRLNGKRYIGKSTNIEARFGKHRRNAKDGRESYFYNAIRKYGLEQFDFEVLEECTEEELNEREKHYIDLYNTLYPSGYNLTPGGDGGDVYKNRSEAENKKTREKMSASHKGLKHTPGERAKISAAQKGKPRPYMKGRSWNQGKTMTDEFCKAVSDALKGSKNGMFGKTQSKLCREVNSKIHKGQVPANKGKHLVWDDKENKFHYE